MKFCAPTESCVGTFQCSSGVLFWGPLNNVVSAISDADQTVFDVPPQASTDNDEEAPVDLFGGGTIRQAGMRWRTRAKKGEWRSLPYTVGDRLGGVVVHHVTCDPVVALRKAADTGISNDGKHERREVLYVGRYDHGWHSQCNISALQGPAAADGPEEEHWYNRFFGRRLITLDGDAGPQFLAAVVAKEDVPVGTFELQDRVVGMHSHFPNAEYEFAWMCYNSENELEAIVWDSAYHVFENHWEDKLEVCINGKVLFQLETPMERVHRLEAQEAVDDPPYVPSEDDDDDDDDDDEEEEEEGENEEDGKVDVVTSFTVGEKLSCDAKDVQFICAFGQQAAPQWGFNQAPKVVTVIDISVALTCINTTHLACSAVSAKEVFELASRLPHLAILQARHLNFKNVDDYSPLWTAPLKRLRRLVLDTGCMDNDHCPHLAELALRCHLIELDVSNNNQIGPEGAVVLLDALSQSRSIEVFSLRNNKLEGDRVRASLENLIKSTHTLRVLDIEPGSEAFTFLPGPTGAKLMECVERALEHNYSIERVRFAMSTIRMRELFARAVDAREACRDAAITFLLCRQHVRLAKPIASIIAKYIWSTRGSSEWAIDEEEGE